MERQPGVVLNQETHSEEVAQKMDHQFEFIAIDVSQFRVKSEMETQLGVKTESVCPKLEPPVEVTSDQDPLSDVVPRSECFNVVNDEPATYVKCEPREYPTEEAKDDGELVENFECKSEEVQCSPLGFHDDQLGDYSGNHVTSECIPSGRSGPEAYECVLCRKAFKRETNLTKHMAKHPPMKTFTCTRCKRDFSKRDSFTKSKKPVTCEECDGESPERDRLDGKESSKVKKPRVCDLCGKKCRSKFLLRNHILRRHTDDKPFLCSACNKRFACESHLKSHEATHRERNHRCSLCPMAFLRAGRLAEHMQTHAGKKPFRCRHCADRFDSRTHLADHECRPDGRPWFPCAVCAKRLTSKYNLARHRLLHEGSGPSPARKEKSFACPECPERCRFKSQLARHVRTHSVVRAYACSRCPKTFTATYTLAMHELSHAWEKPYGCASCERRFSNESERDAHVRTHAGCAP